MSRTGNNAGREIAVEIWVSKSRLVHLINAHLFDVLQYYIVLSPRLLFKLIIGTAEQQQQTSFLIHQLTSA